ncbi:NADPH-dependent FMN reductase [Mesorhizobium amorphae]|jgi:NAD(P)H-dependent FMN reductase|uniref:NADPH-dependent FMN reductase n=1 Tax=Mesorhizobium amorphae TaxID=71433 RepID=UPI0011839CD5|nr:NAD(P)H-dependent oxidoreductase [Mesorhizobium amorphae]
MSKPKIAVVIGSTRATRFADVPAEWIAKLAAKHSEWDVELVDLRDYPMPFFDEPASSLWAPSRNEIAQRWQKKVDEFDAFIFTASEYTHGPSAVLKNALDYAYTEWNKKPVGFVGYGGVGGARSIEQLRLNAIELQMVPVRTAVHIVWADYMAVKGGTKLSELEHINQAAQDMLNQLSWYTLALKAARDADLATADVEAA